MTACCRRGRMTATAFNNRGKVLKELNRYDEALGVLGARAGRRCRTISSRIAMKPRCGF